MTDLPMVCKFKFIHYSLKCSIFEKLPLSFADFQALDLKFHLALKPKVLELKGSSFGNKLSIYVMINHLKPVLRGIIILKRREGQG